MSRFDDNRTTYRVEVDWAPAYELVVSLGAFIGKSERRTLDVGTAWIKELQGRVSSALDAFLRTSQPAFPYALLVYLRRGCDRSADGICTWLSELSAGDLYELVMPYINPGMDHVSRDVAGDRDRLVTALREWNNLYFSTVDPAILLGLEVEAERLRALLPDSDPVELVETATGGIHFPPGGEIETVLLVPQYHYRPWNLLDGYVGIQVFEYPADVIPPAPGEPPPNLLRVIRALSDDSRLRILRYLAEKPRSRTEIGKLTGLSRSTVHHHMVALRAAGLVRVDDSSEKNSVYSLRGNAELIVADRLRAYLTCDRGESRS